MFFKALHAYQVVVLNHLLYNLSFQWDVKTLAKVFHHWNQKEHVSVPALILVFCFKLLSSLLLAFAVSFFLAFFCTGLGNFQALVPFYIVCFPTIFGLLVLSPASIFSAICTALTMSRYCYPLSGSRKTKKDPIRFPGMVSIGSILSCVYSRAAWSSSWFVTS